MTIDTCEQRELKLEMSTRKRGEAVACWHSRAGITRPWERPEAGSRGRRDRIADRLPGERSEPGEKLINLLQGKFHLTRQSGMPGNFTICFPRRSPGNYAILEDHEGDIFLPAGNFRARFIRSPGICSRQRRKYARSPTPLRPCESSIERVRARTPRASVDVARATDQRRPHWEHVRSWNPELL